MKRFKCPGLAVACLCLVMAFALPAQAARPHAVMATIFPVAQIAGQVTAGREGVSVATLLPSSTGCPHDYALSPQAMRRLMNADLIIGIGLGLDDFAGLDRCGRPVVKLGTLLPHIELLTLKTDHHSMEAGHRHAAAVNPHVFSSPRLMGMMALALAEELAQQDPEGADLYRTNAKRWADSMNRISESLTAICQKAGSPAVTAQYGVLDYFLRDAGLKAPITFAAHSGQAPAASVMLNVVKQMREQRISHLLLEPAYAARLGQMLHKETGAAVITVETGVVNDGADTPASYEQLMRRNLERLRQAFKSHAD